jgi:hypothetical protein
MTPTIDREKIIYADLDPKEGVVLNLETKNYYRLNETGQRIWQGLLDGKSAEALSEELTLAYDVTPETARADVDELLRQMQREELVTVTLIRKPN